MERVLVVGIGNTVRGDDAVGLLAVRRLRASSRFLPSVQFLELEASLVGLLDALEGVDALVVLDSLIAPDGHAGRLRRVDLGELAGLWPSGPAAYATHQLGLVRLVRLMDQLDLPRPSRVEVCAVEVASAEGFTERLSAEVAAALEPFVQLAAQAIGREHHH